MNTTFPANTLILIVDDMPAMRSMLKEMLKGQGYSRFIEAQNGKVGLATALERQAAGDPVGLILSDWNMPEMTGFDFLKAVRQAPEIGALPFILVTSEGEVQQTLQAVQAGVSQYLAKPFTDKSLAEKLQDAWKRAGVKVAAVPEAANVSRTPEEARAAFEKLLVEALQETFATTTSLALAPGEKFVRGQGTIMETKLAASASFSGSAGKGSLILAFPEQTFLEVMSLFLGKRTEERNWENQGGAGEILNMTLGLLARKFNAPGFELKCAIPVILHGRQVVSLPSFQGRSVVIPMSCVAGPFYIEYLFG